MTDKKPIIIECSCGKINKLEDLNTDEYRFVRGFVKGKSLGKEQTVSEVLKIIDERIKKVREAHKLLEKDERRLHEIGEWSNYDENDNYVCVDCILFKKLKALIKHIEAKK